MSKPTAQDIWRDLNIQAALMSIDDLVEQFQRSEHRKPRPLGKTIQHAQAWMLRRVAQNYIRRRGPYDAYIHAMAWEPLAEVKKLAREGRAIWEFNNKAARAGQTTAPANEW